jgi:hypothetical protein
VSILYVVSYYMAVYMCGLDGLAVK